MSDPSESQAERLDRRLERGAIDVDDVIEIARMLAAHLDAEHGAGRADGAVVPARVELREGASVLVPGSAEHRGQKSYVAPEAWIGEPSAAADQFSMAAILYEALCGGRAFPGDDSMKIRVAITTGSRVPLAARVPGLADAVDDVFGRALALEPENRYPSCGAFTDALIAAIERSRDAPVLVQKPMSRPPSARPPPMLDAWGDEEDEPPIPWMKVAVGLLLLAVIAALLALSGRQP
jgi:serine/threonine protein kinase